MFIKTLKKMQVSNNCMRGARHVQVRAPACLLEKRRTGTLDPKQIKEIFCFKTFLFLDKRKTTFHFKKTKIFLHEITWFHLLCQ